MHTYKYRDNLAPKSYVHVYVCVYVRTETNVKRNLVRANGHMLLKETLTHLHSTTCNTSSDMECVMMCEGLLKQLDD